MEKSSSCPKCNYVSTTEEFSLCPKCGIIIKRYHESLEKKIKVEDEAANLKAHQEQIISEQRQKQQEEALRMAQQEEDQRREQEEKKNLLHWLQEN